MQVHGNSWYYARGGQAVGPVSVDTLRQLVAAGQLLPGDLVWREGMSEWTAISSIPGLLHAQGPAAPQPVAYYTPAQYRGRVVYAGFWLRWADHGCCGRRCGVHGGAWSSGF